MTQAQDQSASTPQNDAIWPRLAYMAGYALISYVVFWLTMATAALQFVVTVVRGAPHPDLVDLSKRLSVYLGQLLSFLTFQSDDRPFPFEGTEAKDVTNS
ncbi:MAG: DUF4389 domain-containing protein [Alphaproteobacteria bacterium]